MWELWPTAEWECGWNKGPLQLPTKSEVWCRTQSGSAHIVRVVTLWQRGEEFMWCRWGKDECFHCCNTTQHGSWRPIIKQTYGKPFVYLFCIGDIKHHLKTTYLVSLHWMRKFPCTQSTEDLFILWNFFSYTFIVMKLTWNVNVSVGVLFMLCTTSQTQGPWAK